MAVSSEMDEEEFDWQVDQQVPVDENEVYAYMQIKARQVEAFKADSQFQLNLKC